jgi:hypothetical protein
MRQHGSPPEKGSKSKEGRLPCGTNPVNRSSGKSRLPRNTGEPRGEGPSGKSNDAVVLDGTFRALSGGNGGGTRGDGLWDKARWTQGNPRVLLFSAEGASAWNWEEVRKDPNFPKVEW